MIDKIDKTYPGWWKLELYFWLFLIWLAANIIVNNYDNFFALWAAALQVMLSVMCISYNLLLYDYTRVTDFLKDLLNEVNKEGPESTRDN